MKVVLSALTAQENSLATCVLGWLRGWPRESSDVIHLVAPRALEESARDAAHVSGVELEFHPLGSSLVSRLRGQLFLVPRVVRSTNVDAVVCAYPVVGRLTRRVGVVVVAHDFRHEMRPEEFSVANRIWRRLQYHTAFNRAERIVTVSRRTFDDLVRLHPAWREKSSVMHLGAELPGHVEVSSVDERPLAIAYAQHVNKRPELSIRAWAQASRASDVAIPRLIVLGAPENRRQELIDLRTRLGLTEEEVGVVPRLSNAEYRDTLARARFVLMPSAFEGFGLPVLEALQRGIPPIITPEPAMMEVGGPFVWVATDHSVSAVARQIVEVCRGTSDEFSAAARAWAGQFTWEASARTLRSAANETVRKPDR